MSGFCRFALIAAACLAPSLAAGKAVLAFQSPPATAQAPKGYKAFADPAGRISLLYPDDWKVVAGARDLLLTITTKNLRTVVVVEVQPQQIPRATTEITSRLMENEVGDLRIRQPDASDVKASRALFRESTMVVDYSRPGINGVEQVRQYGIYEGTLLLRVTCIALRSAAKKDLEKWAGVFEYIARSVKVHTRPAGGKY